jgi:copper(I)-binding protein
VAVGATNSLTFTITNVGSADLTGLGITIDGANSAMFTVITNPIAPVGPGSNTTFTVSFAPTNTGVQIAALHIANNDTNNNPFTITLTGTGLIPIIGVQQPAGTNLVNNAATNNFGSVAVGATNSLTFTITNNGSADLTISGITVDGTDAASFTVTNLTATVSPGGSTNFTVSFAPAGTGAQIAALHIASNDPTNGLFNTVLTGTGAAVAAPIIGVQQPAGTNLVNNAATNNFGSVAVGATNSLTFTITNNGSADLTISGITVDGTDAASFTVTNLTATVSPGGSTNFTVSFAPAGTGAQIAALHIASNDPTNGLFNTVLTGTGAAVAAPIIGVQQPAGTNLVNNAATNNFGSVAVGATNSLTFTITNNGSANLTITGITIDGTDAAMFSVTNLTATVSAGGSTNFTVSFAPAGTGAQIAALHIASNDPTNGLFNTVLTGTGTNGAIIVLTNVLVIATSPTMLNPQTGLFTNSVLVTNSGPNTIAAVRLLILLAPANADVRVYNASGRTTNGTYYVQYNFPLAPGATVDFTIEYYRASRRPIIPPPTYVVQELTNAVTLTVTNGVGVKIDNITPSSGGMLIGFYATPGRSYAVQYSSDMTNWLTADPFIIAPANYVQWFDQGPPKTQNLPATRFYRAFELP